MTSRHRQSASFFREISAFVRGMELHPRALDRIFGRVRVSTVRKWHRKLQKIRDSRAKLEQKNAELNRTEAEIIHEAKKPLDHLQKGIRFKYDAKPEVRDDFFSE